MGRYREIQLIPHEVVLDLRARRAPPAQLVLLEQGLVRRVRGEREGDGARLLADVLELVVDAVAHHGGVDVALRRLGALLVGWALGVGVGLRASRVQGSGFRVSGF